MKKISYFLYRFLSLPYVSKQAAYWALPLNLLAVLVLGIGFYWGLFVAPLDYQQGDMFRVIYIHVPAAILSLFIYTLIGLSSICYLVWKTKIHDRIAQHSAPIGLSFTLITLITGAIWGKPMWGAYWVWDARLTAELILGILYLGYIGLNQALARHPHRAQLLAYLGILGLLDVPIVHYSVKWWYTLHQGQSLSLNLAESAIHSSMLKPLLICILGFFIFYGANLSLRLRPKNFDDD
ncbi:MAG: heme ABC transporter permease CcmC [Gammaproteobacteria bacterium]